MAEFIKFLDQDFNDISREIIEGIFYNNVFLNREKTRCPFCGRLFSKNILHI